MKLIVTVLLLVVLHLALSKHAIKPPVPDNVETLCASTTCPKKRPVCRVVKKKCNKVIQATCLRCVHEDADDVCNDNYYLRAVLVKSGNWHKSKLYPHYCDYQNHEDGVKCPSGSACIKSAKHAGLGVCCYGKLNFIQRPPNGVSNNDRVCGPCAACKNGENGKVCKEWVNRCGRLRQKCVKAPPQKPGICPRMDIGICAKVKIAFWCKIDSDCPGSQRCCNSPCGGKVCSHVYLH